MQLHAVDSAHLLFDTWRLNVDVQAALQCCIPATLMHTCSVFEI